MFHAQIGFSSHRPGLYRMFGPYRVLGLHRMFGLHHMFGRDFSTLLFSAINHHCLSGNCGGRNTTRPTATQITLTHTVFKDD